MSSSYQDDVEKWHRETIRKLRSVWQSAHYRATLPDSRQRYWEGYREALNYVESLIKSCPTTNKQPTHPRYWGAEF